MSRKLVLVTGMPRSGTTVIGERLLGSKAIELYEPMNQHVGDVSLKCPFPLLGEMDDIKLKRLLWRIKNGLLFGKIPPKNIPRHPLVNRTRRTMLRTLLDRRADTVIWKDPFAVFIAPALPAYDIPVIVTIRDPLASAASFQRMKWFFDTEAFQKRMQLHGIESALLPDTIGDVRRECASAARLWNLTHRFLLEHLKRNVPMTLIGIEHNLSHPREVGVRLEAATGITPKIVDTVQSNENPGEVLPEKAHIKNRSAESVTHYWKKVLTEDEIAYVRTLTDDLYNEMQPWLALE